MKKNIFFFLLFIITFFSGGKLLYACSCVPKTTNDLEVLVKDAYKKSVTVFSGEVIEVIRDEKLDYVQVKMRVEKSWKTDISGEIIIKTGFDDGDCDYKFEVGEKYLVYTYGTKSNLKTSLCQRNSLISSTEDIEILEKIKKPNN